MQQSLAAIGTWLHRRAENLLAAMLAAMFLLFIVQIICRYLLGLPTGWSNEASVVLWLWLVLWGAAFVLREDEEIRFDLFIAAARPGLRRVMTLISVAALLLLYGVSLPASYDYVSFMKVEKTAYLKLRFDWLFSIYILFTIAVLLRYLWLGWQAIQGRPEATRSDKVASGI